MDETDMSSNPKTASFFLDCRLKLDQDFKSNNWHSFNFYTD